MFKVGSAYASISEVEDQLDKLTDLFYEQDGDDEDTF
jgi:hypothetical protein